MLVADYQERGCSGTIQGRKSTTARMDGHGFVDVGESNSLPKTTAGERLDQPAVRDRGKDQGEDAAIVWSWIGWYGCRWHRVLDRRACGTPQSKTTDTIRCEEIRQTLQWSNRLREKDLQTSWHSRFMARAICYLDLQIVLLLLVGKLRCIHQATKEAHQPIDAGRQLLGWWTECAGILVDNIPYGRGQAAHHDRSPRRWSE